MAHHGDTLPIFADPDTNKPIPGAVAGHKIGHYQWTDGGDWLWVKTTTGT
jgi:hypothetical protein